MIQSEENFRWKTCPSFKCLYQVRTAVRPAGGRSGGFEWTSKKTWDDENSWKMLNEQYSRNNLILEKSIKQQFVKNAHLHVKVSRYYLKERFIEPNDSFKWLIPKKGWKSWNELDMTVCINLINTVWYLNTIYVTFPRNSYGFW